MHCVVVFCSVVQCGAVCWCVAVCCIVVQCVVVCCSMLQCVAVCCSVLQCVAAIKIWSRVINSQLCTCPLKSFVFVFFIFALNATVIIATGV